jgi:hypothetical protein
MSSVTYRYEQSHGFKKKGVKHSIKEQVIDGPEGVSVMYLEKVGDDKFYKMYAKETGKDKYHLKETKDGKDAESEISEKELIKMLKSFKLESIVEYITKERGTYKGGAVDSKKASKKSSKKKSSKKSSKRLEEIYDQINVELANELNGGAKKKRSAKKSSKKSSKKPSKKSSKKSSKK